LLPPASHDLSAAFGDLTRFLSDRSAPPLVTAGLGHAQFETIHPFLDGNGRIGRLLITLVLVERQVLSSPLLYLSLYLKQDRTEYWDRLAGIRSRGDWEGWLKFFLTGVAFTADDASAAAAAITELRDRHLRLVASHNLGRYAAPLLDLLAQQPLVTVKYVVELLGATPTTVGGLLDKLVSHGVVEEVTGRKRDRVYRYSPCVEIFMSDDERHLDARRDRWRVHT
jgi:Fic family protein